MAAPIAPYGIPPMMNQVDFQFQNLQMRQQIPSQYHHMQQNNHHMINMHRPQMPQVPQRQQPERQGLFDINFILLQYFKHAQIYKGFIYIL